MSTLQQTLVLAGVLGCSHPPKHSDPPTQPTADAAVEQAVDVAGAAPDPDAAPQDKPALFDWDAQRKRQDEARAARMKRPSRRCEPDPNDPHNSECASMPERLAAQGRVGARDDETKPVEVVLDIGSDDGVSGSHWGAVIDDDGRRVTKFHRVRAVGRTDAALRVEPAAFSQRVKVVLVLVPPRDERGTP